MKAAKDTVVGFHFRLSGPDGTVIEDSRDRGRAPWVLLGHGQLFPALEEALEGHEPSDSFEVELSAQQAYGERRDDMIQRVPKKYFHNAKRLKPGMLTSLALRQGGRQQVTVHKVGMSTVDVDLNHPLAGLPVRFDIVILDVREAAPEELAHGHAHPPEQEAASVSDDD